jgi:oxygen-dependent protoporphyrinogen oxidase
MSDLPHIAVVGGGISGLSAAHALLRSGRANVTLLEADRRLGGKIRSEPIGDQTVDVGAEALFARVPGAIELCRELGLGEELVGAARTATAVWTRGHLRELPAGIFSGLPDGLKPVLRSGILSPLGLARGALDLVLPASRGDGDRSVGQLVRSRLGRQALDRLVDPLLGTIYATDCDRLSARAAAPQLDALARGHRSLIQGLRAARPTPQQPGPLFVSLPGGLERIVVRLREELHEVDIRCSTPVRLLERAPDGSYQLDIANGKPLRADGVLIAAPHDEAARILSAVSPNAATELEQIGYSSTIVVTMRYSAGAAPEPLSLAGFLVPQSEHRLLGACTCLSAKWPHLTATGEVWLRCSVGRASMPGALKLDDATLVARLAHELKQALGLRAKPLDTHVMRWERSLPRYEPGHLDRVARIEDQLARLPGLELAGAAYRGIGVPQCITQGQAAAERILAAITDTNAVVSPQTRARLSRGA